MGCGGGGLMGMKPTGHWHRACGKGEQRGTGERVRPASNCVGRLQQICPSWSRVGYKIDVNLRVGGGEGAEPQMTKWRNDEMTRWRTGCRGQQCTSVSRLHPLWPCSLVLQGQTRGYSRAQGLGLAVRNRAPSSQPAVRNRAPSSQPAVRNRAPSSQLAVRNRALPLHLAMRNRAAIFF